MPSLDTVQHLSRSGRVDSLSLSEVAPSTAPVDSIPESVVEDRSEAGRQPRPAS